MWSGSYNGSTGRQHYVAPFGAFSFRNGFLENRDSKSKIEENNFHLSCNFLSNGYNFIFLAWKRKKKHCFLLMKTWKVNKNHSSQFFVYSHNSQEIINLVIIPHKRDVKLPSIRWNVPALEAENAGLLRPNNVFGFSLCRSAQAIAQENRVLYTSALVLFDYTLFLVRMLSGWINAIGRKIVQCSTQEKTVRDQHTTTKL